LAIDYPAERRMGLTEEKRNWPLWSPKRLPDVDRFGHQMDGTRLTGPCNNYRILLLLDHRDHRRGGVPWSAGSPDSNIAFSTGCATVRRSAQRNSRPASAALTRSRAITIAY